MKKLNRYNLIVLLLAVQFSGCDKAPVPTADFGMDKFSANVNETIYFINRSRDASSYSWKFGDGSTSNQENPTHIYSEYGTYTVELTATGEGGTNSVSKAISVVHPVPVADFLISTTEARVYDTIMFTNTSVNATSYFWDFDDGQTSTLENPKIIFSGVGQFLVELTASSEGGTSTASKVIQVGPPIAVAGFTVDRDTAEVGETIQFTNTSRGATGYLWDFGDGTTSTQNDPVHSYDEIGTYIVELSAIGVEQTSTISKNITIVIPAPDADFTVKSTAEVGETIIFDNTSVGATSYFWDFGDGSTSILENPTHEYSETGTYTITLTASGEGGTDTKTATIEITEATILGNWILAEGSYNGLEIPNLSGYFHISSTTQYEAAFDDGTDDGLAQAKYTYESGVFDSNINGHYIQLVGQTTVSDNTGVVFYTSMHCSSTVFDTWGATAIGLNLPTVVLVGDQLVITSSDGRVVLTYDEE